MNYGNICKGEQMCPDTEASHSVIRCCKTHFKQPFRYLQGILRTTFKIDVGFVSCKPYLSYTYEHVWRYHSP